LAPSKKSDIPTLALGFYDKPTSLNLKRAISVFGTPQTKRTSYNMYKTPISAFGTSEHCKTNEKS
jgi:hypothetical protein